MGRPARNPSADDSADESVPASEGAPAAAVLDDEARIQAALAALPPDTRTKLYRVDDFTKRWQIHGVLAPHEVSQEYIARKFGGGTYEVRVMRKNAQGGEAYTASAKWIIPGPYKGAEHGLPGIDRAAPTGEDDTPHAAATGERPTTLEFLDRIVANRAIDVLSGAHKGGVNLDAVAALITAVGAVVTPLLTPVVQKMIDGGGARDELAELKAELRALRNAPTPSATALSDSMAGMRQLLELRDLLGERGGGKSSTMDRILDAAPAVLDAIISRGAPPPAVPDPAAGTLPVTAPPIPETPAVADPAVPHGPTPWHDLLRAYRGQLLQMAQLRWEPDFCADFVVRVIPPDQQGMLAEFVQRDDALTIATEAVPELQHFATWTPAFLAELKARVADDDDGEGDAT